MHIIDMPGMVETQVEAEVSSSSSSKSKVPKVPLIILGGAAQTIFSWLPHYRSILKGRRLIIPEMRCQGKTELLSEHTRMDVLIEDFANLLHALGLQRVDLAGFSYGGRVALAVAAHRPELVHRLSVTGVCTDRGGLGKSILESWRRAFDRGNLEEAGWSFVLNGYSNRFIEQNADKIETHVDMVVKSNDVQKLRHLYAVHVPESDPYSVRSCVQRLQQEGRVRNIQILAGLEDRITSVEGTRQMSQYLRQNSSLRLSYTEFAAGHLAPFEMPGQWRSALLSFLDQE